MTAKMSHPPTGRLPKAPARGVGQLDYPTWAISAEGFAPGAAAIWRRQFRRAYGLGIRSALRAVFIAPDWLWPVGRHGRWNRQLVRWSEQPVTRR